MTTKEETVNEINKLTEQIRQTILLRQEKIGYLRALNEVKKTEITTKESVKQDEVFKEETK